MEYSTFNSNDQLITELPPISTDNITKNQDSTHQDSKNRDLKNKHVSFDDNFISAYTDQQQVNIPDNTIKFSFFADFFPYILSLLIVLYCTYIKHF